MKSQNRDVQEKPVRPSHGLSTLRPSTAILAGCTAMFAATTTIADAAAAPATPSNAISQAIRRLPTNGITTPDSAKGARLGIVAEPVDPGKHIDGMAHGDKPGYNNPHSDSMGTRHVDYTEWLILHGDYQEPIHFDTPHTDMGHTDGTSHYDYYGPSTKGS